MHAPPATAVCPEVQTHAPPEHSMFALQSSAVVQAPIWAEENVQENTVKQHNT